MSAVGFVLAAALVLVGVDYYRNLAHARLDQLARLEVAYARVRTQEIAAHLPTIEPPLTTILGPSGLDGQGAPAQITFTLQAAPGKTAVLTCTDPTGAARYVCTTRTEPTPKT
jgi:hypothetical protein